MVKLEYKEIPVLTGQDTADLTAGLSAEQGDIVRDYIRTPVWPVRRWQEDISLGRYRQFLLNRAWLMVDFLRHPEDFEPTEFARQSAYLWFVRTEQDGEAVTWPEGIDSVAVDPDRLLAVANRVTYGCPSTDGHRAAILELSARVRGKNGEVVERNQYLAGFCLDNWVRRKAAARVGLRQRLGRFLRR